MRNISGWDWIQSRTEGYLFEVPLFHIWDPLGVCPERILNENIEYALKDDNREKEQIHKSSKNQTGLLRKVWILLMRIEEFDFNPLQNVIGGI